MRVNHNVMCHVRKLHRVKEPVAAESRCYREQTGANTGLVRVRDLSDPGFGRLLRPDHCTTRPHCPLVYIPRFKVSVQHETRDSHNNSAWQCITERVESEDQPCTEPRKGHKAGVFAIFRVFGVCLGPLMSLGLPYKYNVQVIVCRCGSLSFDMFAPEINRIIHAK